MATLSVTRERTPGATASIQIEASPEAVWEVVSDGSRLPEWLTPIAEVRGVATAGELAEGSEVKVKMVGRVPPGQKVAIHEAVPGQKLSARVGPAFAHALGIAMRAELTLEPSEEATAATVGFTCNPITGPLQRRISGMNLDEHVRATAQHLKEAAEAAGESVDGHAPAPLPSATTRPAGSPEEKLRYLQGWLAFSERLDRLIEAAEVATNVDTRRS